LLFFLLGIAVGRGTVKSPPTASDVDREITKAADNRKDEATRHGVIGAVPLLEKLRIDAINAVQALLKG
jgi:hypothetical protein